MKNPTINVSFKTDEFDLNLYKYIQTKRDKSSYIKDLIEQDMNKNK